MSAVGVKKVKPYPIPILITTPSGPIAGQILRLEVRGMIVDTGGKIVIVGHEHNVSFTLPVSRYSVASGIRVMKTKDRVHEGKVERIAEFRFGTLSEDAKKNIHAFLHAIHQLDDE